jgi:hypothetical protein
VGIVTVRIVITFGVLIEHVPIVVGSDHRVIALTRLSVEHNCPAVDHNVVTMIDGK